MRKRTSTLKWRLAAVVLIVPVVTTAYAHRMQEHPSCAPGPTTILNMGDVSPRVYGSYTARKTSTGDVQLCLLVLWRGEANWHIHRYKAIEALRKRSGVVQGDLPISFLGGKGRFRTFYEDLGDVVLEYDYDWEGHRVHVLGRDLDLGTNNVLLIDHADGMGGTARVSEMLWIDPTLGRGTVDIKQIASRSPAVQSFFR
jgi:hypothetical protein